MRPLAIALNAALLLAVHAVAGSVGHAAEMDKHREEGVWYRELVLHRGQPERLLHPLLRRRELVHQLWQELREWKPLPILCPRPCSPGIAQRT